MYNIIQSDKTIPAKIFYDSYVNDAKGKYYNVTIVINENIVLKNSFAKLDKLTPFMTAKDDIIIIKDTLIVNSIPFLEVKKQ